ncbi:uncharacterized protein LOC116117963 [Pistacia vera]|uniref:uncharacterized protein LOC116117963 n=1 Tax=Pistacia vera TaxID=55513 RepID=UPI00126312AD|nr:uncharacterized protein LOC116117963 [Pistacia vera]
MGCASSKRIEAATGVDVYRPAPASFAVFDINAIQEPWLTGGNDKSQENQEKPTHVPASILEKLNKFETDAPHSWDEVSKALEDLKPTINNDTTAKSPTKPAPPVKTAMQRPTPPRKSASFHTLEEFDEKISSKPANKELKKTQSMRTEETNKKKPELNKINNEPNKSEPRVEIGGGGYKPVKENIFILKDRLEKEKEGKQAIFEKLRRDPLSDFPEKCPPGGADSVVVYTTSLRGVRRTFEDCARVLNIFEVHRVVTDERDVSLHGEFLKELRELLGEEEASVPRVFMKGRYVGGVEELSELNETGKLGRIVRAGRLETGIGRQACEGCGGARFVPCLECGGSCKVVVDGVKERCGKCNENGLAHCPACA